MATPLKTDAKSHSSLYPKYWAQGLTHDRQSIYICLMTDVMEKEVAQVFSVFTEDHFSKKVKASIWITLL